MRSTADQTSFAQPTCRANGKPPTNEWAAIQTVAEAQKIADEARANKPKRRSPPSKFLSSGFFVFPVRETRTKKWSFSVRETRS